MLRRIEWRIQNGSVTKNGVLSVTILFLKNLFFSLKAFYKDLI